jgi:hypothetical protein
MYAGAELAVTSAGYRSKADRRANSGLDCAPYAACASFGI